MSLQSFAEILHHGLRGQDPQVLIYLLLAALLAGLARGFSGFGAALIFVPLASAIAGPQLAGPILLIIDLFASAPLLPDAFKRGDKRDVGVMAIGAFLCIPLGTMALLFLDPQTTRWGIAITAFCFLILLLSGWRYRGEPKVPLTILVGAIAGFFSGVAQLGGPPVVTYWLGGQFAAARVRANLVLYFAISSVFTAVSYFYAGLLSIDAFVLSALTGPVYGLGLFFGARAFRFAREETFRKICFALIGLAAIVSLPLWDGWIR